MGFLSQASSPIVDSDRYSASFWSYISRTDLPSVSQVALFQHGPKRVDLPWAASALDLTPVFSGINIEFSSSGGGQIYLSGSSRGNDVSAVSAFDGTRSPGTAYFWTPIKRFGRLANGNSDPSTAPVYPLEQWVHIAYSIKIQATTAVFTGFVAGQNRYDPGSYSLCSFVMNGVSCPPKLGDESNQNSGDGTLPGRYNGWPINSAGSMPNGIRSHTLYWPNDSDYWQADEGPIHFNSDWPTPYSVPAYNLAFSGFRVGVPTSDGFMAPDDFNSAASVVSNPIVRYGDFQLWVGQYIDWTNPTNFSKVVNISGGHGTPVDPRTSAAAFGPQSVLFKGKSSDASFYTNAGTAGAFTKTGTITDFTPTPTY